MRGRKPSPVGPQGVRSSGAPLRSIPEPPGFLRPRAAEKFRTTSEYLIGLGAVTIGDVGLIARYAAVFDRWVSAEEELAKGTIHFERLVTRTGDDGSAVPLPAMLQAAKCHDQLMKLESALGLNPVERSRLSNGTPEGSIEDEIRALVQASGDGGDDE
jgi:P27 family predicted phage terminase small subunit